jgi:hypothetical protein
LASGVIRNDGQWRANVVEFVVGIYSLVLSCYLFHLPRSPILRWGLWIALAATVAGSFPRIIAIIARVSNWYGLAIALVLLASILAIRRFLGQKQLKSILWWLGCVVFLLFLPNAAYILTDVIHLIIDIRKGYPLGVVAFVLIPQYLLFIGSGFAAYVIAIIEF